MESRIIGLKEYAIISVLTHDIVQAAECDTTITLEEYANDSLAVNLMSELGLFRAGSLPSSGLTILLPSNEALENLAGLIPSEAQVESIEDIAALWSSVAEEDQQRLISTLLYHIVVEPLPLQDGRVMTALTAALPPSPGNPEFQLRFTEEGQVVSGTLQRVDLSEPFGVCDNIVFFTNQVLVPTLPTRIPPTSLEDALSVFAGLGGSTSDDISL